MTVDPHTARHRTLRDGHPVFFCSAGCKTKFEANPASYLKGPVEPAAVEALETVFHIEHVTLQTEKSDCRDGRDHHGLH